MVQQYQVGSPVLQIQNISLTLGENLILRNVNETIFDIQRPEPICQGQVIAFLGPSGRGKTLLSKILAGLQPPTSGQILVNSPAVPVKAGMVGYVTQNYLLRRNRTILGNLILAGKMHGMTKAGAKEKSLEYLQLFELIGFEKKYPAQLSGGQRQRVAIAQQLLCSDHYLIMDEPFSGLDPIMKEKVCELIIRVSLLDEFNTIIVVSHDIRAALKVADTAWCLGQDRNEQNKLVPGSYIKYHYNLMERGLCWDPNISKSTEFNNLVLEVENDFKNL